MSNLLLLLGRVAWIVLPPIWRGLTLTIWRGLTLRILWGWFIVPVFDMPALSIAQAIGLQYVVGFITNHYSGEDERSSDEKIAIAILMPLVSLAFGYIVQLFM